MAIKDVTKISKDIEYNIESKELDIDKILKEINIDIETMVIENK